jgi:ferric-dicitrate binding protein FerR (iron transport regulator)
LRTMRHLRIEVDQGDVRLITPDGRTLTPDMVTIKIQAGQVVRIKVESRDKPPEFFTVGNFYGNGAG